MPHLREHRALLAREFLIDRLALRVLEEPLPLLKLGFGLGSTPPLGVEERLEFFSSPPAVLELGGERGFCINHAASPRARKK